MSTEYNSHYGVYLLALNLHSDNLRINVTGPQDADNLYWQRDVATYEATKVRGILSFGVDHLSDYLQGLFDGHYAGREDTLIHDQLTSIEVRLPDHAYTDILKYLRSSCDSLIQFEHKIISSSMWIVFRGINAYEAVMFASKGGFVCPFGPACSLWTWFRSAYQVVYDPARYRLTLPNAVAPTSKFAANAGYDLTIVKLVKTTEFGVYIYDTGVQLIPPPGYYYQIVARSGLQKLGWMLANSVGIIDANYTGNVMVGLVRLPTQSVSDASRTAYASAAELSLPCVAVQALLTLANYHSMQPCDDDVVTSRGSDGGIVRS